MVTEAPPARRPRRAEHRLAAVIFLVVVLSYAAAGVLWLAPSLIWERERGFADLAGRTERALKVAQTSQNASSTAQIAALLESVMKVSPVSGAVLLNDQDHGFREIGDAPPADFGRFRRGQVRYLQAPGGCCIDLYLKRDRTGLPYNMVARIDAGNIQRGLADHLMRTLSMGIMTLLFGGVAAVAVLYWLLIGPLGRLRGALADIAAAKPAPALPQAVLSRADVVGEMARIINPPDGKHHLVAVPASGSRRSRHGGLINEIPLEVLSFDADGGLADANDAALWFFQCQTFAELEARDLCVFLPADDPDGEARSLPDLLRDGPLEVSAVVIGRPEPVPCRILARADRNDAGEIESLVACLLPLDGQAEAEPPGDKAAVSALEARVVSLKLLLEACLTLIATPDPKALASATQPVRTDILVEGWYLDASRSGLVDKKMEHSVPGQVVGDPNAVESLLRHALSFVALRSQSETPVLAGSGTVLSADAVEFVFEEVDGPPVPDPSGGEEGGGRGDDSKLPLAALSKLLAAYGGKVLAVRGEENRNLIRFAMRARPPKAVDMAAAANKTAA